MKRRWQWALSASVLWSGLSACGGGAPAPEQAQVKAAPVDQRPMTDAEYVEALSVHQGQIWARGADRLVRWFPTERRFQSVRKPDTIEGTVTAAAEVEGRWFLGLSRGLAIRDEAGNWTAHSDGPLAGGITALSAGEGGGLWVGMAQGLALWRAGTLQIVSRRHKIRDFARATDGTLWAATAGHGVLQIKGGMITEHVPTAGLCDLHVTDVEVAADGRVIATCPGRGTLSIREGDRWGTWRVVEAGAPVKAAVPFATGTVVWTDGGVWQAEAQPAPLASAGQVTGPRLMAIAPPSVQAPPMPEAPMPEAPKPEAPKPEVPKTEAAPAAAGAPAITADAPAATPAPATTPAPAEAPAAIPTALTEAPPPPADPNGVRIDDTPMQIVRAKAEGLAPAGRVIALQPLSGLPRGAISALTVAPDGTVWVAQPHRGLVGLKGGQSQSLITRSLVAGDDRGALTTDGSGDIILRRGGGLLRLHEGRWRPWSPLPAGVKVLSLGPDPRGGAWALGYAEQTDELVVAKGFGPGTWNIVARKPGVLPAQPRAGRLVVGPQGALLCPLFRVDEAGRVLGEGLLKIHSDLSGVERWEGDLLTAVEPDPTVPHLPDGWINGVYATPGTVWVASNAGLVQVKGVKIKVFDENAFMDSEVIFDAAAVGDRVWVATLEGLGEIRGGQWKGAKGAEGVGSEMRSLVKLPKGALWAAGPDGVYRLEGERWQAVEGAPVGVKEMIYDGRQHIWALSDGGIAPLSGRF